MKKSFKIVAASLIVSGAFLFTACSDESSPAQKEVPAAGVDQSDDANSQRDASDEAIDVVTNSFTSSNMRINGWKGDSCNMVTTANADTRTLTFTFNGDNCAGIRTRTGVIVAKMLTSAHWYEKGAMLEVTYTNYKVVRKSDNKSLTINGKHIITNVNGSLANPIVHKIRGSVKIKFDNNAERSWSVFRKRTVAYADNQFVWTVESDSTGTYVTEFGENRAGKQFVTTIPTALVVKSCTQKDFKAVSGKIIHSIPSDSVNLAVEFGYKSITQKVENCDATGMLLMYTDPNTIVTKYYPYK